MATVISVSLITALSEDLKEQFRVKVYFNLSVNCNSGRKKKMKIRKWTLQVYQKTHLTNLLKIIPVNFEHLQIKVFLSSMLLFLTIHFLTTVCSFCLPQIIMPTLFVNMWHYMGFYINIFEGWIFDKICIIIPKYQKCLNIHQIFIGYEKWLRVWD